MDWGKEKLHRFGVMDVRAVSSGEEGAAKLYDVAVSSESEVERWFGIEVLSHERNAIDLARFKRGAAVLVDHSGDQVGVVEDARVDDDRVLRARLRFSQSNRGREVEQDVADGIRKNISVGYFVSRARRVEDRDVGKDENGKPVKKAVWRVTRWTPAEVSIVSVPADISVGVGRSVEEDDESEEAHVVELAEERSETVMEREQEKAPEMRPEANEEKRAADIVALCAGAGMADKAGDFIASNATVEQVAKRIQLAVQTKGESQPAAEALAAVPAKDRKRYSYARALLMEANFREGRGQQTGLEAEVHQELLLKMAGPSFKHRGGLMVPTDLRSLSERWEQRALDSVTATKGVETVFESPGEFIELLRNNAVVMQLGARLLGGLTGPVAFPKQTGGMSLYWVGENPAADVTASDPLLGQVQMAPKSLQGTTSYSRQFLAQSSIGVEAFVREEFAAAHGLEYDRVVYHGEGAAGEPMGIYKAPDVKVETIGGAIDAVKVNSTVVKVAEANAHRGSLAWVTSPKSAGTMRQTPLFSGATGQVLWEGPVSEGSLIGYRAVSTTQLSTTMSGSDDTGGTDHGTIFGNWAEVIIGMWAGLEVIVDPYAQKKRGMIEVTSFAMTDLVLRHGQSFCKWTGNDGT